MYYLFFECNIESIFFVYVRVWDREWDKRTDIQTYRQTDRERCRVTGRERQANRERQTERLRQTDRQTEGESFQWRSLVPHPTHGYASSVLINRERTNAKISNNWIEREKEVRIAISNVWTMYRTSNLDKENDNSNEEVQISVMMKSSELNSSDI